MTNFLNTKHSDSFQDYWQQLYVSKHHCDITLPCDGKLFEVHRVVISSNSPALAKIMKSTAQSRPFIYFTGINHKILESFIDFMYKGSVAVLQQDLGLFLAVAKELQIKGLSGEKGKSFSLTFHSLGKANETSISNSSHSSDAFGP